MEYLRPSMRTFRRRKPHGSLYVHRKDLFCCCFSFLIRSFVDKIERPFNYLARFCNLLASHETNSFTRKKIFPRTSPKDLKLDIFIWFFLNFCVVQKPKKASTISYDIIRFSLQCRSWFLWEVKMPSLLKYALCLQCAIPRVRRKNKKRKIQKNQKRADIIDREALNSSADPSIYCTDKDIEVVAGLRSSSNSVATTACDSSWCSDSLPEGRSPSITFLQKEASFEQIVSGLYSPFAAEDDISELEVHPDGGDWGYFIDFNDS